LSILIMSTQVSTLNFLLDQLKDLEGVRSLKMFGEYTLYLEDKIPALLCDDQLFIKITKKGEEFLGEGYPKGHPYPGAKLYFSIGADVLENPEKLIFLLKITAQEIPAPQKTVRKKKSGLKKSPSPKNKAGKN